MPRYAPLIMTATLGARLTAAVMTRYWYQTIGQKLVPGAKERHIAMSSTKLFRGTGNTKPQAL